MVLYMERLFYRFFTTVVTILPSHAGCGYEPGFSHRRVSHSRDRIRIYMKVREFSRNSLRFP